MSARLVLNADDFGYDPAVSRGIERSMRHGVVSSTTMMVNTPYAADAATLAKGLSIGLHLNLARFHALSLPSYELVEANAPRLDPAFVHRETLAQLDRLEALIGRVPTHLDVHKHLHQHPPVLEGLLRAAADRQLPVRSIDAAMRATIRAAGVRTNDAFIGDTGTDAWWTPERFAAVLADLPDDGLVELMCHPGYAPTSVTSGYAAQREVELATFCGLEAREVLEARGLCFEPWS
jgi:chitin disaccharide deacetylase